MNASGELLGVLSGIQERILKGKECPSIWKHAACEDSTMKPIRHCLKRWVEREKGSVNTMEG
jgi:hypothetical protein